MGWETRDGLGRYYTRSRRIDGRVVRDYLGSGIAGEIAYADDLVRREAAFAAAALLKQNKGHDQSLDELMVPVERLVEAIARGHLLLSGFHQHHRGEWRRNRGSSPEQ